VHVTKDHEEEETLPFEGACDQCLSGYFNSITVMFNL